LHYYKIKSVYDRDDEHILVDVEDAKQKPKLFDEESLIFRSIDNQMSESFVEVYAPVEYKTHIDRRKIIIKLAEPIKQLLTDYFTK